MSKAMTTRYDAIVLGAGIGGLTTGALLAKAGKRTLVVEKENRPGGYASPTPVRVNGHTYLFDGAARSLMGCNAAGRLGPGPIYSFLDEMGDEDRCEFMRLDPFCRVALPGLTYELPLGEEAFIECYRQAFGADPAGLRRLLALCRDIYRGAMQMPHPGQSWKLIPLALRYPALVRYMSATLGQGLAGLIPDERLRNGLTVMWGYLGTPPQSASFLMWAAMMATYVEDGAFYCRGSLQRLSDVFAGALLKRGGELLLDQAVTGIQAVKGKVTGVTLANGQHLSAPVVISSLEPRFAFRQLLGEKHLPAAYLRQLETRQRGPRAASLFLVTDLDLRQRGMPFETLAANDWNPATVWNNQRLEQPSGFSLTVPTIPDPGLAPAGQHMVSLTCVLPPDAPAPLSSQGAAQLAQGLLAAAETLIPGIRQHLLLPAPGYVLQQYDSLNGWDCTPQESGSNRMGLRTPVRGLFQVGQWTQPGHGVMSVVLSGRIAARLALSSL